jgi:hypothetical protein
MMGELRPNHVEEFNFMQFMWMNKKFVYQVGNNKKSYTIMHGQPNIKKIMQMSDDFI